MAVINLKSVLLGRQTICARCRRHGAHLEWSRADGRTCLFATPFLASRALPGRG